MAKNRLYGPHYGHTPLSNREGGGSVFFRAALLKKFLSCVYLLSAVSVGGGGGVSVKKRPTKDFASLLPCLLGVFLVAFFVSLWVKGADFTLTWPPLMRLLRSFLRPQRSRRRLLLSRKEKACACRRQRDTRPKSLSRWWSRHNNAGSRRALLEAHPMADN